MKTLLLAAGILCLSTLTASAHCQIPCGIYGDDARFVEMKEHVVTLKKSVMKIQELSKDNANANQTTRWVLNKEQHADKISEIVHKYFLAQRIKADTPKYTEKLVALHKIIVLSMKVKQTVDPGVVDKLGTAITDFEKLYTAK